MGFYQINPQTHTSSLNQHRRSIDPTNLALASSVANWACLTTHAHFSSTSSPVVHQLWGGWSQDLPRWLQPLLLTLSFILARHGGSVCYFYSKLCNQPAWKSLHTPTEVREPFCVSEMLLSSVRQPGESVLQNWTSSCSSERYWRVKQNPRHTSSITQAANTQRPVLSLRTAKLNYLNLIPVVQTSLKGVKFGLSHRSSLEGNKLQTESEEQQSNSPASDSYLSKNTRVQCVIKISWCERWIFMNYF